MSSVSSQIGEAATSWLVLKLFGGLGDRAAAGAADRVRANFGRTIRATTSDAGRRSTAALTTSPIRRKF